MAKKEIFTTPKASCRFPFLTIADTKFNPDGIYRIEMIFDPKVEEHKKFLEHCKNLYTQSKGKNLPYKKEVDLETKEETGKWVVKFTSNFRPKVFDAKGYHMDDDVLVGNGSVVKVSYGYTFYEGMNGGVKLYLQAVQVLELVEWNGGSFDDFGFQAEQGYSGAQEEVNKMGMEPTDETLPF
jgi:hypothetical protein